MRVFTERLYEVCTNGRNTWSLLAVVSACFARREGKRSMEGREDSLVSAYSEYPGWWISFLLRLMIPFRGGSFVPDWDEIGRM